MTTRVMFRGKPLVLDDKLLLGQGGEARVFAHPTLDLALKIFHAAPVPAPGSAARTTATTATTATATATTSATATAWTKMRALRAAKLAAFPRDLPAMVVAPLELVLDVDGALAGYAMAKVSGAVDIAALARRATRPLKNDAVLAVFRALVDALAAIHARGVVCGDLNDGNVVLDGNGAARIIDADSMQVGALPCPVAHERFLDPRLYGRSLVDEACFDAGSDAFAARVLLFQSLLCVHPYGGVHAKYPTLLRRAEAAHSILRGDVQLPRAAFPVDTLPDDLLEDMARCFDRGARAPLDPALLDVRFRTCSCGIEHARTSCPACKTAVQAPAIRTRGGVSEDVIVETKGTVLAVTSSGGHIAYLVDEDGRVRREDHSTVLVAAANTGARTNTGAHTAAGIVASSAAARALSRVRFAIAGDATWIASGGALVKVRGEQVVDRAHTAITAQGEPVFAAGAAGLFVVEGDALVHNESRVRVGRVVEGRTVLLASDDGGLALWFAGRALYALAFSTGGAHDLELPAPRERRGKLVDVACAFGDGRALIGLAEDVDGKRVHTLALVDARGHLVASASGDPERAPMLESIRGKCIANGRILSASNSGVVAVDVDGAVLRTGSCFADTQAFVDAGVELLPGPGGSLVVVAAQAVTRLRLR